MQIQLVQGKDIIPHIPELARLRIQVFRDYPYLYDGDMRYEQEYLHRYTKCPDFAMVLAVEQREVVGASTCLPLKDEVMEFQRPFREAGYNPKDVFYLAESVLLPRYRGQGIGIEFFKAREQYAKDLGGFQFLTFCAVERPQDHPLKPHSYQSLNPFWQHRGYTQTELMTSFSWLDIGERNETLKPMRFWLKEL